MKTITLLPADIYTVINKTVLTEVDRNNLISLYEPIIGPMAVSLYLTLWRDLDKLEIMSIDFTHHHLMSILKSNLEVIKSSREALESVGLLKTYLKIEDVNKYVYELYSPLPAIDFFNHPVFNVVLFNNIGKKEYDSLKKLYEKLNYSLNDYEDISKPINTTFKSTTTIESVAIREKTTSDIIYDNQVDFDLIISSLPKNLINEKTFNKRIRDLINSLSFIYNLDSLKITELIRIVINEKGCIDKEELRKNARKFYQYSNNGTLPTLIYRTQPDYLKSPLGDNSSKGKIIYVFENTSPYDFLKSKYKGNPTSRDLKIIEYLIVDIGLKPAVVNVLIDYVLRRDNNKLNMAFVETIAGQWKRLGIQTAVDAMEIAKKEHTKYNRKTKDFSNKEIKQPVWFNEFIEKEEISQSERQELEELLKEFR